MGNHGCQSANLLHFRELCCTAITVIGQMIRVLYFRGLCFPGGARTDAQEALPEFVRMGGSLWPGLDRRIIKVDGLLSIFAANVTKIDGFRRLWRLLR